MQIAKSKKLRQYAQSLLHDATVKNECKNFGAHRKTCLRKLTITKDTSAVKEASGTARKCFFPYR